MKGFFAGVSATVLGGVLLFLLQTFISDRVSGSRTKIDYFEYSPAFVTSAQEVTGWQKSLRSTEDNQLGLSDRIAIGAIIIENKGSQPIANQSIVIASKYNDNIDTGVLGYKNDVVPGKIGVDTIMSVKDGQLKIQYKLLDVGEMHRFW